MRDPNTPGNVRTRYIGQWMFYGGLFVFFLGLALALAEAYGIVVLDVLYANFGTYAAYLLIVIGAFVAVLGYLFQRN
ncbi:hypothetical protein [Brevibacillus dissolubilis]|uniref:hypothetical protein n=1 Tax=Brevibacillus dissolubilis TaxID=1844116 RepID=UPI0011168B38|nr:hypothetical protein [Brevibacillus dissolubilis]